MRSEGQSWALEQLEEISKSNDALEIVDVTEPAVSGADLKVSVSINCSAYPAKDGGIPLRPRERLLIFVPALFPLAVPALWFAHSDYGGFPHVQWGQSICLYQSPETEWQPADGMFGFVQRVHDWFRAAAANELDPAGMPLHPPVAYHDERALAVVPTVNTPIPDPPWWAGYAKVTRENDVCVELGEWVDCESAKLDTRIAPAILLPGDMPFEYPDSFAKLKRVLESRKVPLKVIRLLLTVGALTNPEGKPLVFVLGAAMRGIAGSERRQHLAAWRISAEDALALREAVLARTDDNPLDENLVNEWAEHASINWCSVLEDRPEIVVPRDSGTPAAYWRERHVAILGCGALGSTIAMFLARAGIRKVTLYDKAIVKPGVLVRQMFDRHQVGSGKAHATRVNVQRINPKIEAVPQQVDIIRVLDNAESAAALQQADVVINATASARVAAALEQRLRHWPRSHPPIVSMAIGHRADCGLMTLASNGGPGIALDLDRRLKLECANAANGSQLLNEFWPTEPRTAHLFQPEPGCSDPTFVGSAADIAILTGRMLNVASGWLESGTENLARGFGMHLPVTPHTQCDLPPEAEYAWPRDDVLIDTRRGYQIRVAPAARSALLGWMRKSERQWGPTPETGGVLFGEIDRFLKVIWVTTVSGPPPDSQASRSGFVCGTLGVQAMNTALTTRTRGSVSFIGMWHTHPDAAPDPSHVDRDAMAHLFASSEFQARQFLMLIIGGSAKAPVLAGHVFDRND
ncbi:ThiF family adenylyltransferase [Burkholderia cepacia]|uniref:ThiF family adenylyltransferase n=1 Tax=Burkholderia cepacia TaxID=292 RepID=UPI002AB6B752|nr:ThiF family adenylyltransferase [Burkholderia cepacia]